MPRKVPPQSNLGDPAPLRNALRPGDWHCPQCNCDRNFARRKSCFKCGYCPPDRKLQYKLPLLSEEQKHAEGRGSGRRNTCEESEAMDWIIEEIVFDARSDDEDNRLGPEVATTSQPAAKRLKAWERKSAGAASGFEDVLDATLEKQVNVRGTEVATKIRPAAKRVKAWGPKSVAKDITACGSKDIVRDATLEKQAKAAGTEMATKSQPTAKRVNKSGGRKDIVIDATLERVGETLKSQPTVSGTEDIVLDAELEKQVNFGARKNQPAAKRVKPREPKSGDINNTADATFEKQVKVGGTETKNQPAGSKRNTASGSEIIVLDATLETTEVGTKSQRAAKPVKPREPKSGGKHHTASGSAASLKKQVEVGGTEVATIHQPAGGKRNTASGSEFIVLDATLETTEVGTKSQRAAKRVKPRESKSGDKNHTASDLDAATLKKQVKVGGTEVATESQPAAKRVKARELKSVGLEGTEGPAGKRLKAMTVQSSTLTGKHGNPPQEITLSDTGTGAEEQVSSSDDSSSDTDASSREPQSAAASKEPKVNVPNASSLRELDRSAASVIELEETSSEFTSNDVLVGNELLPQPILTEFIATCDKAPVPAISMHIHTPTGHKRKCRNFYFSCGPTPQIVTSALDGSFKFWDLPCSCHAPTLRTQVVLEKDRWPEDFAWHPSGTSVISVFDKSNGIGQDELVAVIDAYPNDEQAAVTWLNERPHKKGPIRCVEFMPWSSSPFFVTAGADHAVASWRHSEKDSKWEAQVLHEEHTASIYSVTGPRNRCWVVSGGVDRRIIVYDAEGRTCVHKNKYEDMIVGVCFNPMDPNLLLSHSCEPGRQFSLYDVRVCMQSRLHTFGWDWDKRTVSSQVSESWSPCGFYVASGSLSPKFPIFDIRFNRERPVLTIATGDSRFLKAAWHPVWHNNLIALSATGVMSLYEVDRAT